MKKRLFLTSLSATLLASTGLSQQLMVPESTNDAVMLFDAFDGSLINPTFIDMTTATGVNSPATPIKALQAPNGDIIISDQFADEMFRWSADGTTYLGESAVGFDNMRGFEIAGGFIWVANSGTQNAGFDDSIVQLDLNFNLVMAHPLATEDPFDCQAFTFGGVNGLLVPDWAGDNIAFFDPANPAMVTIFHDSDGVTGVDNPEQATVRFNGNVLVGGFTSPDGIYEYEPTGFELRFIDTGALFSLGGLRGVHELGNGNIMYTNGGGVHIYDPVGMTSTTVVSGVSARFITELAAGGDPSVTPFCGPANANSTGGPAVLTGMTGTGIGSGLHLEVSGGPDMEFGYFLVGTTTQTMPPIPISNGLLCLSVTGGSVFGRYNVSGGPLNSIGAFDATGVFQNLVGTSTVGSGFDVPNTIPIPGNPMIMAGDTWHFQLWYRDTPQGVGNSNLSNGVSVTF